MRKRDGEPTFKLKACVCELRGKRAVKRSPKKAVSVVATETQEHNYSVISQRTKISSFDSGEGTSCLASKRSDSEYFDQEQEYRVPAFGQEEERDDQAYCTAWV